MPCLQRMLTCLQPYDATISYKPGNKIQLPDTLSRSSSLKQRYEIPLDLCVDYNAVSNIRLASVHKETKSCLVLCTVYRLKQNGWPATCRQTMRIVHKYNDKCNVHTSDDGLLLKGFRVIIPPTWRKSFLHDFHEKHAGITECQLTARTLVFWPSSDNDIEDYIK